MGPVPQLKKTVGGVAGVRPPPHIWLIPDPSVGMHYLRMVQLWNYVAIDGVRGMAGWGALIYNDTTFFGCECN